MSGANFNDTTQKPLQYDLTRTIRSEADFPAPILAPDGNMRIPLEISSDYVFDVDQIDIATPFLMPSRLLGFERARFQSLTNTTMNYSGTIPLFWGRNQGPFETDKLDYVGVPANNATCFDMVAAPGTIPLTIFNTAFVGLSVGSAEGFAMTGFRVGFFDLLGGFRVHNASRCFYNILILSTPTPPAVPASDFPVAFIFTGGIPVAGYGFDNVIAGPITNDQSYYAIDSNATFNQAIFRDVPFDGLGGTFFERDLTGSISAFANLVGLITGSPTAYEDDGNGNVLVTDASNDVYVGLTVDHSGTTNYNGQHLVIRSLGINQYVMDATYVSDEGSGSYTGIGTRVTTSAAHEITDHRTTDISATTNYNGTGLEVFNVGASVFDIVTAFVADDATGTYLTTSLDQTHPQVLSTNNGALPNSMISGEAATNSSLIVVTNGGGIVPVVDTTPVPGDWIEDPTTERVTIDTTTGIMTYIGVNEVAVELKYSFAASVVGGGTQILELHLHINSVEQTKTLAVFDTASGALSGNYPGGIFKLFNGDTIQLFVQNTSTAFDTNVAATVILLTA